MESSRHWQRRVEQQQQQQQTVRVKGVEFPIRALDAMLAKNVLHSSLPVVKKSWDTSAMTNYISVEDLSQENVWVSSGSDWSETEACRGQRVGGGWQGGFTSP